jgi:hypothetical protein
MTKRDLANLIIETLDNYDYVGERNEKKLKSRKLESVIGYLNTLVPKDREQFAQWGKGEVQSTPEKCWED